MFTLKVSISERFNCAENLMVQLSPHKPPVMFRDANHLKDKTATQIQLGSHL